MKRDIKKQFVVLLNDLARQLEKLDNTEFEKVLSGELGVEVRVAGEPHEKKPKQRKQVSSGELERLHSALRKVDTREQARRLIDDALQTKDELSQLARILDIPVPRNASIEHLKARLVEATVGFRIRSAAVQGKRESSEENSNRFVESVR